MIRQSIVIAGLAAAPHLFSVAASDDDPESGTSGAGFWLKNVHESQTPAAGPQSSDGAAAQAQPVVLGNNACDAADSVAGEFLAVSFCSGADQPVLTAEDVRRAFEELKLPAGTLTIQPPDGLTLVNFKTNFYTTSTTPISTSLTLLGQQVTLEATPASFVWNFGDGESTSTTEPGAPYPDLTITHSYLRKGDYLPSLSTTYTGRYRIATGAWQTIPGTVTIDGPGQPLRAVEAQPKLVGY
jgi:hypothetical protein